MVARWQVRSTPPLVKDATNDPRAARCARTPAARSRRAPCQGATLDGALVPEAALHSLSLTQLATGYHLPPLARLVE